jgi:choline-sulfatase
MDIGSSLLDWCGLESLPGASGRSFRCLLDDSADGTWDDTAFSEYAERGARLACRMVRSGPWKFNYYHNEAPELFHMAENPGETVNRAADADTQDLVRQLMDKALAGWDPERVATLMERRSDELALIGNWARAYAPPEPDRLWFDTPPENCVDNTVQPPVKGGCGSNVKGLGTIGGGETDDGGRER